MPTAKLLNQVIENSDVISIARIKNTTAMKPTVKPRSGNGVGFLLSMSTFLSAGHYELAFINQLKGPKLQTVDLDFPSLSSFAYASSFTIRTDQLILVFLRREGDGLVPTDPLRPYIPLQSEDTRTETAEPVKNQIIELLSRNLQVRTSRRMMAYLLKDFDSPEIVSSLAPYSSDEDLQTRDYVLSGLARNQQIAAVPKIRDLNRLLQKQRGMAQSVVDLENFNKVKAAVPFLNPLLFETEQYIRLNTLFALSPVVDSSSIPYLLLTLSDPEPQKVNAESAFALLQRLTGNASSVPQKDLRAQKVKAIQEIVKWWQDELSGKHPVTKNERPRVALRDNGLYEAKDVPMLNEGLFMRSESTRSAAIKALSKLADQSSIPYLLIAQYDPKPDIAYGAYKTLHRLIPSLGQTKERALFEAQREALVQEGFDWWVKHLQEAETKRLPPAMQQKAALPAAK